MVRALRVVDAHAYTSGERVLVGKLVDEIARVTPEREVGAVVVVCLGVGAGAAQARAVAVLFVEALAVGAAGGGTEGVQGDVGGLSCTVAADSERNLGGGRGCSGPSPAMEVVVWAAVLRKAERRWDGMRVGTRR